MSTLRDLRDQADTLRGDRALGFSTDAQSNPDKVAIAISLPDASFVVTIDRSEYDGVALAALLGFETMSAAEWRRRTKGPKT